MSLLPEGQPLRRALPDLDDLLEDPHAYLSEAPLAIGPRRMYRLAALFAVPGLACLLSCVLQGKADGERIALGIGLLLGSSLWLGWSLWLRGHELVLYPEGLEVNYRGSTVWAPWALFHASGQVFVPQSDAPRAGLILPINPAAVPYVELRRGGLVQASGLEAAGPQWRFTGLGEVCLPARYEIDARDLGELLAWLGGRLGRDLPGGTPPVDEKAARVVADDADPAGWFTVPLTRFRLPTCCCGCGGPRDAVLRAQVTVWSDRVLGFVSGNRRTVEIGVPVCEACREALARRQRTGGVVGLLAGTVLGTTVGGLIGAWLGEGRQMPLYLGALMGLCAATLIGSTAGLMLSRRLPVRFRRYNPNRGTVSVRFDNPEIAAGVLARLREPLPPTPAGPPGDESDPFAT
jgi:hypothetical protein